MVCFLIIGGGNGLSNLVAGELCLEGVVPSDIEVEAVADNELVFTKLDGATLE